MSFLRRNSRLRTRPRFRLEIESAKKGVNTLVSATRLSKDEAQDLTNMWLIEDGVPDKRPGTAHFGGATWTNRPDGMGEYVTTDGSRELIVVGDGKGWKVAGGTKTEITGATFTQGERCDFLQFADQLYICNGVDPLARYYGTDFAVYTGINPPAWAGTPIARTGLTAGNYNYYYQVSATNEIGETEVNAQQTISTNKVREDWDGSNYLTLDWDAVAGAVSYKIYMSDFSGYEVFLAEVEETTYVDNGSAIPNQFIEPVPEADADDYGTTAGPKFTKMTISGNRIWATGDPDNPYRVYWTGTGVDKGNFAAGGYIDLELGSGVYTVDVKDFQNKPYVFMTKPNGSGRIWNIELTQTNISFGGSSESVTVPVPHKEISNIGASAPRSVVYVENDILYANKQGVFVLGSQPNFTADVLRTAEVSVNIRPTWRALDGPSTNLTAAYYWQAKVLFAVSEGSGEPDAIYVLDRERAAWIVKWTIGVSQFLEHTDSGGVTRLLGIASDRIIEFNEAYESDSGTAFTWRYRSARLPVVKDWDKFAKVMRPFIRVRNASGSINVSINGTGQSNSLSTAATTTISPANATAGLGWDLFGDVLFGDTEGTVTLYATESLIKYMDLNPANNLLRDVEWTISGDSIADRCVITGLKITGAETEQPLSLSDRL